MNHVIADVSQPATLAGLVQSNEGIISSEEQARLQDYCKRLAEIHKFSDGMNPDSLKKRFRMASDAFVASPSVKTLQAMLDAPDGELQRARLSQIRSAIHTAKNRVQKEAGPLLAGVLRKYADVADGQAVELDESVQTKAAALGAGETTSPLAGSLRKLAASLRLTADTAEARGAEIPPELI